MSQLQLYTDYNSSHSSKRFPNDYTFLTQTWSVKNNRSENKKRSLIITTIHSNLPKYIQKVVKKKKLRVIFRWYRNTKLDYFEAKKIFEENRKYILSLYSQYK